MEQARRLSAHRLGDYRDPFVQRPRNLGVESVYGWEPGAAANKGTALGGPGSYAGWEWDGPCTDSWLGGFLASTRGMGKVEKLRRANGVAQRHLVVVLDSRSQAGIGIGMQEPGADLPVLEPPKPLTHLWLIPTMANRAWLRWERGTGWA
jgi:hypothetical protein